MCRIKFGSGQFRLNLNEDWKIVIKSTERLLVNERKCFIGLQSKMY